MFFPYKDDNPRVLIPYVTYGLIVINVIVFLFQFNMGIKDPEAEYIFIYTFGLIPSEFSILTPKVLKAFSVCITSSDISKLLISEIPIEIEGIMIDLWEIDLSEGILIFPLMPFSIFFDII